MADLLLQIDDYIELFGRRWDCRNVVPVVRYIDGVETAENRFTSRMYYLSCPDTGESLVLEERHLTVLVEVAGGEVTPDPLKGVI